MDKVKEEYRKVISKEGEDEDESSDDRFFPGGDKPKPEPIKRNGLIELTVDDTYKFKISELFY